MDSRFQVLDAGFFVSGTLIRDCIHKSDPDSLSCEAQDSGFHKRKFPDSGYHKALISENFLRNPDSLTWGERIHSHADIFIPRVKIQQNENSGRTGNYNGVDSIKTMNNGCY